MTKIFASFPERVDDDSRSGELCFRTMILAFQSTGSWLPE
jgi:hypothetical protein